MRSVVAVSSNMQVQQLLKGDDESRRMAIEALATSFVNDPVYNWVLAESNDYRKSLSFLSGVVINMCLSKGIVYMVRLNDSSIGGVAAWLNPGEFTGLWDSLTSGSVMAPFEIGIIGAQRAMAIMDHNNSTRKIHLAGRRGWYLWHVGVVPEYRGQGFLRRLVEPVFEKCRTEKIPAYLESSNIVNIPMYQKLGFQAIDEFAATGQNKSLPPLYPMILELNA